jgi:hypothetical protein
MAILGKYTLAFRQNPEVEGTHGEDFGVAVMQY